MKYHLKYKHINKEVILLIRKYIKEYHFFKEDKETKEFLLLCLNRELSKIYNIEEGFMNFDDYNYSCYNHNLKTIFLDKPSLISFLHEFKHKLDLFKNNTTSEDNARGYSISLFYQATPNLCLNAIRKGLILHEKKEDLVNTE